MIHNNYMLYQWQNSTDKEKKYNKSTIAEFPRGKSTLLLIEQ